MIDRMDEIKPLRPGMRVLDFACGSGAFLVQCYRRLIEDQWRSAPNHRKPRPGELKELLVKHIFGMDVDAEACRVAELSLLLTLLDYVEPPDLLTANGNEHRFKLPTLTDTNIVEANAFDDTQKITLGAKSKGFDWIIGNPPWKDKFVSDIDRPVLNWMMEHKTDKPTGGRQAAEAFAWRTQDFAAKDALAGLLIPAMTLFKSESKGFRQKFFTLNSPSYVANFANLAEVLFAGRSRVPAAALIFSPGRKIDPSELARKIPVFSPLVANQESTRPRQTGTRVDTWSIVVDQGEVRSLNLHEIQNGDAITWKLAAWGSDLDQRLLRRLSHLTTLGQWADTVSLIISQGLELRGTPTKDSQPVEHHPELAGKLILLTGELEDATRLFSFPHSATRQIGHDETYVRQGRYTLPESVCRPPHILLSAARNWAVFTHNYLVVPARQIGISGLAKHKQLLKALTVYFNSDLFLYHQFFVSPQWGVQRQVSTLESLRSLPIPQCIADREDQAIAKWAAFHDVLAASANERPIALDAQRHVTRQAKWIVELNELVSNSCGLRSPERTRVSDFINVILGLQDGKTEDRAVRVPSEEECSDYAKILKHELDAFVGAESRAMHGIQVWNDENQGLGVIQIDLKARGATVLVHPRSAGVGVIRRAVDLRQELESHFSQWRYFNRNLHLFFKDRIYLFKPMQRFHWLQSQAVLDAGEIISLVVDRTWGAK